MSTATPKLGWLRGAGLGAPGFTAEATFFTESWGLREVGRDADGSVYLRGSGPEQYILSLHDRPVRGLAYVHFGVAGKAAVDGFAALAKARGVTVAAAPRVLTTPGGGYAVDLVDREQRLIRLSADVARHADTADEMDKPRKVTHVVLNTTDIDATRAWYEDMLGMQVSDWSEHQMVFLRCALDHHSIALNTGAHASVNHIAFEMPSIDAQMRGIGRMRGKGHSVGWGVGRHGPGNNTFSYFRGPQDFVIEYTAEVQQIDETTHVPQVWPRVPHLMDRWGTAGPPPAEIRTAMAGTPDPGFSDAA